MANSNDDMPLLVTFTRAAEVLGVSRKTLYALVGADKLKTVLVEKRRMITRESIRQFVYCEG